MDISKEVEIVGKITGQLFDNKKLRLSNKAPYDNLLLVLVDAVLQQGMNYSTFVLPRIHKLKMNSFLLSHFTHIQPDEETMEYILQVKNKRKISTLKAVILLLHKERICNIKTLSRWISIKNNQLILLNINGFGPKTLDYMLNLMGHETMPIDRHVFNFLYACGYKTNKYEHATKIFENISKKHQYKKAALDREVWQYMKTITI